MSRQVRCSAGGREGEFEERKKEERSEKRNGGIKREERDNWRKERRKIREEGI